MATKGNAAAHEQQQEGQSQPRSQRGWWRVWTLALCVAAAHGAGCATLRLWLNGPEGPCNIAVQLAATERVNPDREGRSLPTNVRLYQLKGRTRMADAEFEDVWLRAAEVLEAELVEMQEVTVYPGDNVEEMIELKPDTQYLAVVAVFREPSRDAWRAMFRVSDAGDASCAAHRAGATASFRLHGSRLELQEGQ
jgi:type VI secretion system protein VasD